MNRSREKDKFFKTELSWLDFNERVLAQAASPRHPLLEQLKFLSISASNMDEFYMIRLPAVNAYKNRDLYEQIQRRCTQIMSKQVRRWRELRQQLAKQDYTIISDHELEEGELEWLEGYFNNKILPVLTPLTLDRTHPLPIIPNQGLNMAIELASPLGEEGLYALIVIPGQLERFVQLPGPALRYIAIERIIKLFLHTIFQEFKIIAHGVFRILRDAELETSVGMSNLILGYEHALSQRLQGKVMWLGVNAKMPDSLRLFVAKQLDFDPKEVFVVDGLLGMYRLLELTQPHRHHHPHLLYPTFKPRKPQRVKTFRDDIFEAIAMKDIILHHPYEDFETVLRFFRQSSEDPDVVAIKQTLYRTGYESPITESLIQAARNGKAVTVVVELKAAFDEKANIHWAKELADVGVQVIFGIPGLEVHAKMSLVVRREGKDLCSYAHFGTGNYNATTAMQYTDLSLLTANQSLCRDLSYIFNYITGYTRVDNLESIVIAPHYARARILKLIDDEIAFARAQKPANIWAKMNALTDPIIIKALYKASAAGVKIQLVVRDTCALRPGVKKLSENISVKSIVGRFLEHARIIAFGAGHPLPSENSKVFMTSIDWMTRNLDERVDNIIPILDPTVHRQILDQIMMANLQDQRNSWTLQADGTYVAVDPEGKGFCAHEFFMHHASLSGRGTGPYPITPQFIVGEDL